ncbi:hypothetical protein [Pseudomonas aeruginosa]|uniref:hypothetical protein n=1 Tax=Pseudomonas aeruginosa TaxID=287 RepID=UPI0034E083D7
MEQLSIRLANIIQRALVREGGKSRTQTASLSQQDIRDLRLHGMWYEGFEPCEIPGREDPEFWSVFSVVDRGAAETAVEQFRVPKAPVEFTLTPIEQNDKARQWAEYHCPSCNAASLEWHDGDSVPVPVLPEGIDSYGLIDTGLMVGHCKHCSQPVYIYEFGFSTVDNPQDDMAFCVWNLLYEPDSFQVFRAEAEGHAPWIVSRLDYRTGATADGDTLPLPKGPFVIDFHQFGPFKLEHTDELSGQHGVSNCGASGTSDKWEVGKALFHNLAGSAMRALTGAVSQDRG